MANLVQRIKEKPAKFIVQASLVGTFLNETIEMGEKFAKYVHNYEPQIRDAIGSAGYWAGQIGLPLAKAGVAAGIGYIAVKGAGMFMDKHWYNEPQLENSE